jgi:hypothetical protein
MHLIFSSSSQLRTLIDHDDGDDVSDQMLVSAEIKD